MAVPAVSRSILPPIATEVARPTHATWRWIRRAIIVGVIVIAGVVLRLTYFRPAVIPVTVAEAGVGQVEELVTNNKAGTITARRQAALSPEIGGRVVALPVVEGQRVRKGAVLLTIAGEDLRAQLALQQRAVEAAQSAAAEACANASLAATELERTRKLLGDGFASQQQLDQAQNAKVTADAACAAAKSRVSQADAAVSVSRVTLGKSTLRAPFDAVVAQVATHLGEWITPSPAGLLMPTAVALFDPASIYLKAPLDEVDAGRVRAGLPARITLDAYPGRSFPGRVTRVAAFVSEAEQQNRTFDIEVAFDDAAFATSLLPGTSADVEVVLQTRDQVLRVPTSAVLQGGRVLVVRDDVLVSQSVRTGLNSWEYTEIASGLKAGDLVVTSLDRPEITAGAHVRVERKAGQ